jgi:condensin complex subunit 2
VLLGRLRLLLHSILICVNSLQIFSLANINLNKLDAAFDIDPLFHKMSKTFDEGGAKGLLLVNLGTGGNGCNIVFDSGLAEEEEEKADDLAEASCGLVDTSSLTTKLESFLSGQSIHSLSLVPQLTGLRAEYSQLEEEGFFDDHDKVPISRTRRFAPEPEEEKEADRSIHQDALERSRASLGRATFGDEDESPLEQAEEEQEYADTGFGGFDDGDDDAFDTFMTTDEHGKRFSSISFSGSVQMDSQGASTTTVMLDAIASGQVLGDSEYEFFDSQALTNVTSNAWAGSAHWKPVAHLRQAAKPTTAKKTARTRTSKERIFVDLMQTPDLADIMRKPPKAKSRRANDPLQFSAAIITKYTKNESLLPPDAGIKPTVLSSLFLRPSVILKQSSSPMNGSSQHKTVGFAMDQVETFGADTWDDGSFGGDDDGPGFAMSTGDEDSDFVVEELEGVRKVDKVTVGYATIAKKVDVKRLKRDLWAEVELHLHSDDPKEETNEEDIAEMPDVSPTPTATEMPGLLSFKETVQSMEAAKTQMDVSLSFYFICILHLANEKGLRLDSNGLEDFDIYNDGTGSLF